MGPQIGHTAVPVPETHATVENVDLIFAAHFPEDPLKKKEIPHLEKLDFDKTECSLETKPKNPQKSKSIQPSQYHGGEACSRF